MSRHFIAFTAAIALAGCSAGVAAETTSEAYLAPEDAKLIHELDGAPPVVVAEAPPAAPLAKTAPVREQAMFCDISVVKTSHGVRITPVVRSDRSLSGEYSLTVTKSGGAGSSDISQGGPFDAPRGVKQELGSSEISLERGSRFHAVLKVRAGGREVCRDVRS
ncbi:MAG TPA: curli-like amyloid fiber formation chaperone CsgH [Hyphomonadaceae bacterium]|nr:curli-like amyloid fiber formation chaperone CsgH [Hyphomonadaceae bacterium]HPN05598.1 curli-like amyloid fiber formation chaperone CsgH [Hyphomonadaceae bacterium]